MADPDAAKAVLDELIAARPEDFPWLPTWLQGLLELGSEFTDECQAHFAEADKEGAGELPGEGAAAALIEYFVVWPLDVTEDEAKAHVVKFCGLYTVVDAMEEARVSAAAFPYLVLYVMVRQFDANGSWGGRQKVYQEEKEVAEEKDKSREALEKVKLHAPDVAAVLGELLAGNGMEAIYTAMNWAPEQLKSFLIDSAFSESVQEKFKELDTKREEKLPAANLEPIVLGLEPAALLSLDSEAFHALTLLYKKAQKDTTLETMVELGKGPHFARFIILAAFLQNRSPEVAKQVNELSAAEQRINRTLREIEEDRDLVGRARAYLPGWLEAEISSDNFQRRCNAEFRTLGSEDEAPDAVPPEALYPVVVSLSSAQPLTVTPEHCVKFANLFDTNQDGVIQQEEFSDFVVFLWTSMFLSQDTAEAVKAKRFATESMRLAKGGERMKEILEMVRLSRRQMEALFPRLPGGFQDTLYAPSFETQCMQAFDAADADGRGYLPAKVLRPVLEAVSKSAVAGAGIKVENEHCEALLPIAKDEAGVGRDDFLSYARLVLVGAFLTAKPASAASPLEEAGKAEAAALVQKLRAQRCVTELLGDIPPWLHTHITSQAFANTAEAQFDALDAEGSGSLEAPELFSVVAALMQEQPLTLQMALHEQLAEHYGGAWVSRADMVEFAQAVAVGSYLLDVAGKGAKVSKDAAAAAPAEQGPEWWQQYPSARANYQSLDAQDVTELVEFQDALAALLANPDKVAGLVQHLSPAMRDLAGDSQFRVTCQELASSAEARIPEAAYVSAEKRREAEDETFRGEGLLGLITELADSKGVAAELRGTFPADCETFRDRIAGDGSAPLPRAELLYQVARSVFLAADLRARMAVKERRKVDVEDHAEKVILYTVEELKEETVDETLADFRNLVFPLLPEWFHTWVNADTFDGQCTASFDAKDKHSDGHVDGRMLTVVISSMAQMKELTVDSQDVEDFGRRFSGGDGITIVRDKFPDFVRYVLAVSFLRYGEESERRQALAAIMAAVKNFKHKMSERDMLAAMKEDPAAVNKVWKFLPEHLRKWLGSEEFAIECLREFDSADIEKADGEGASGKLPRSAFFDLLVTLNSGPEELGITLTSNQCDLLVERFAKLNEDEGDTIPRAQFLGLAQFVFVSRFLVAQTQAAQETVSAMVDEEREVTDHAFLVEMLKKIELDRKAVLEVVPHLPSYLQEWLASPTFAVECQERFAALDEDGSGMLEPQELYACVVSLATARIQGRETQVSEEHCEELCAIFDRSGKGSLSIDEFAEFARFCVVMNWVRGEAERRGQAEAANLDESMEIVIGELRLKALLAMLRAERAALSDVVSHLPTWLQAFLTSENFERQCTARFDEVDRDGSGAVDPKELSGLLQGLSDTHEMSMKEEHVKEFFELFDADGNGMVSRAEFAEFVRFAMSMSFLYAETAKSSGTNALASVAVDQTKVGLGPGEASDEVVEKLVSNLQQARAERATAVEEAETLKVTVTSTHAELEALRAELAELQANSAAREAELVAEVEELRKERETKGDTLQVLNLARDVRHLQVDLESAVRTGEVLRDERNTLSVAVDRLQRELTAAVETIEDRDQQVRHLQIDLAAAKSSNPDPQTAVSNAIALASHHALHQEQRLRARAEEKVSWLHEKLQETGTFLQNEKLEHERTRRKLEHSRQYNSPTSKASREASAAGTGPLGPYKEDLGTTMLGPKKGKKWASTSKLPTLKQTI